MIRGCLSFVWVGMEVEDPETTTSFFVVLAVDAASVIMEVDIAEAFNEVVVIDDGIEGDDNDHA